MARPHRPRIPHGLYHVSTRGNLQAPIFLANGDRMTFLALLDRAVTRHGWRCHAYCLMTNHYHLVLQTPEANLSDGMTWLNGGYARSFNRAYERRGHLFESRFYSVVIEDDAQLVAVHRYVALNPVEAGVCRTPERWPWSSYAAMIGLVPSPPFLSRAHLAIFGSMEAFRRAVAPVPGTVTEV